MKKNLNRFLITITILAGLSIHQSQAQSAKLFFGDLLNGAVNGAALGGATMALQNSSDVAPLRVGVGLGILYGAGIGLYDNSIVPKGQEFYISGTFNDGRNSSILVLLDTFYGAAGGATIGGAISLIANDPIVDGIKTGAGAGAWLGFGFGLIDAFVLAEGPDDLQDYASLNTANRASGIVQIASENENVHVGLIHPAVFSQTEISAQSVQVSNTLGVQLVNVNVGF